MQVSHLRKASKFPFAALRSFWEPFKNGDGIATHAIIFLYLLFAGYRTTSTHVNFLQSSQTCSVAKWCPMLHPKVALEAPCSGTRCQVCSRWYSSSLRWSVLTNFFVWILTTHTVVFSPPYCCCNPRAVAMMQHLLDSVFVFKIKLFFSGHFFSCTLLCL